MKLKLSKGITLALLLAFIGLAPLKSNADVITLSLVADASGSIPDADFNLQIGAYTSIFGSGSFYDTYLNPGDTLYANFIWFSTAVEELVPFTAITDNASASSFATNIGNTATLAARGATVFEPGSLWEPGNTTSTGPVTDLAVSTIAALGDVGADRQVIDISTDGVPTSPADPVNAALTAAANANAAGITVNAIGVAGVDTNFLDDFTTAGGGFFVTATDFTSFQSVLEEKLETELAPPPPPPPPPPSVPEPGMLGLFGIGLLGLGLARRRRVVA